VVLSHLVFGEKPKGFGKHGLNGTNAVTGHRPWAQAEFPVSLDVRLCLRTRVVGEIDARFAEREVCVDLYCKFSATPPYSPAFDHAGSQRVGWRAAEKV